MHLTLLVKKKIRKFFLIFCFCSVLIIFMNLIYKIYTCDIKNQTVVIYDRSDWMAKLPDAVKNRTLKEIAIPGSHNSGSYTFNLASPLGPDLPYFIAIFGDLQYIKRIIRNWSRTQNLNITQQLKLGIRYFDIRVAYLESSDSFHFVHGLLGPTIEKMFKDMSAFLDEHPNEVIIIDVTKTYSFGSLNKIYQFSRILQSIFGETIIWPYEDGFEKMTLMTMQRLRKQVVLLFQKGVLLLVDRGYTNNTILENYYIGSSDIENVLNYFSTSLGYINAKKMHIHQLIITPNIPTLMTNMFGSLKALTYSNNNALSKSIQRLQREKAKHVNIVSFDFVDYSPCAKDIIALNYI